MFIKLNKRAQSTLEYGIVIAVVVAALIAMQIYFKRGIQGKLKQSTDDIGSQFSPGQTNISVTTRSSVTSNEDVGGGSWDSTGHDVVTTSNSNQTQNRFESANVATSDAEYMP